MNILDEPPASPQAVDRLVEVVRAAFACESRSLGYDVPIPPIDLTGIDPHQFLHAVKIQHVEQLLAAHAHELDLPGDVVSGVQELASGEAAAAMTLAVETARAWASLDAAGIRAIAFKGVTLSAQTTGTVTARGSGDIDLLIDPADVIRARDVLASAGWHPWHPTEYTSAWWPWLSSLVREMPLTGTQSSVDLHWRIAVEPRFLPPTRDVLHRSVSVELLGQAVRGLGSDDLLLAACYTHQCDRFASLRLALDVARVLRARAAPVRFPRRQQAMVDEACAAAVFLVGGVPAGQLDLLGLPPARMSRLAAEGWQHGRCHPYLFEPTSRPIFNLSTVIADQRFASPLAAIYRAALSRTLAYEELRPRGRPSTLALYRATARTLPGVLRRRRTLT